MKKKVYPADLKHHLFECHENGESVSSLSTRFGPTPATIYKWIERIRAEQRRAMSKDETKIAELQAENLELKRQVDFLKKAAAWFASQSETGDGDYGRIS